MSEPRLLAQHSTHVDRIRDYTGRLIQPEDIVDLVMEAVNELDMAIDEGDVVGVISALRRFVAVGGLAQANANRLERAS